MATAAQIKALLQSYGSRDDERFFTVALQVAASEARQGHEVLARQIRELVVSARDRIGQRRITGKLLHVARPQGEAAELLEHVERHVSLRDLILPPPLRERVDRILLEQQNIGRLREHDLRPRQKLLFTGPPGCGKTMTASALASELGLPLFVVRLDGLIAKYLGESLTKLRIIFEAVNETRAVYLFDEFDSIGYARDHGSDVGEMRRVLNSFLMASERLASTSLIIAATNHGERLDNALYRRFDDLIEFGLPAEQEIVAIFKDRLTGVRAKKIEDKKLIAAARGLSHSEITRACEEAVKEMLLRSLPTLTDEMLLRALIERRLFLNHSSRENG
jgi:SpoVK/Ycf46/Vps4 family AAA+-type ATPase